MIRYSKRKDLFSGLHFNASCPLISHFLFADDSIIFCKAALQLEEAIQTILQDYATVSGQEKNYQKSSLFFDNLVPFSLLDSITSLLGIPIKEGHGTYLGLPCLIGRSKKEIFRFVKD